MKKIKKILDVLKEAFFDKKVFLLLGVETILLLLLFVTFNIPLTVTSLIFAMFILVVVNFFAGMWAEEYKNSYGEKNKTEKIADWLYNPLRHSLIVLSVVFIIIVGIVIVRSPVFNAEKYGHILKVENVKANNVFINKADQVRKVSQQMALVKANKILGTKIQGVELNTQYELGHGSVVKYQGKEVWLFPLEYSGLMKWLFNNNIPGYVIVSATDPNAKAVFVHKPFKYSPSAWFMDNIKKIALIRNFLKPVRIHFEIDEDGNPYWIISNIRYKFFGNVFEVSSVDVVDAKTGKVLENVPTWVDKTLPEDLVEEYVEYYGKYNHNSFWSYLFVGKNVLIPTSYSDREMWLIENKKDANLKWFTGLTSKNKKDNSLTGAILVDTKTLKAYFVEDASGVTDEQGAIEAIDSKLGANSIKWQATLPMPFIINNKWYWVTSIVDKNTGLYQKEGAVEGKNISNVVFGQTLEDIINNYIESPSNVQGNKITRAQKKQIILQKINKMEKEIKELRALVNSL